MNGYSKFYLIFYFTNLQIYLFTTKQNKKRIMELNSINSCFKFLDKNIFRAFSQTTERRSQLAPAETRGEKK